MTINVVNVRSHSGPMDYIGRACYGQPENPLRNPYKVGTHGNVADCIAQYRRRLWLCIKHGSGPEVDELRRLAAKVRAGEDVYLACWCKRTGDEPCHGDVVKSAIEWMIEQESELSNG